MRHVDDGTIHAWLDGQVTDRAEAAWIDEHLRWCGACAARVAEERGLLEQAHALLATAAPAVEAPEFSEVAGAAERRRVDEEAGSKGAASWNQRRLLQLGWAASVLLAAAIGWMARDVALGPDVTRVALETPAPPRSSASPRQESPAPGPSAADGTNAPVGIAAQPGQLARVAAPDTRTEAAGADAAQAPREREPEVPPPPRAETREFARQLDSLPQAGDAPADTAARAPAAPAAVPVEVPPPPADAPAAPAAAEPAREAVASAPAPPASPASQPARQQPPVSAQGAAAGFRAPALPVSAAASTWLPLPRTEAAARSGMALYGLEGMTPTVTTIRPDNAAVRTVYRLQSGATVELFQERAASPSSTAQQGSPAQAILPATSPRTWSEIRDGVRLLLQTQSPTEDVNAIAARLRVE